MVPKFVRVVDPKLGQVENPMRIRPGCVNSLRPQAGFQPAMQPLTKDQEAAYGLELASKRQEHADLDAAISTLQASGLADQMLLQRLKKRKLLLKDRIVLLENMLLPDIIA